MIRSVKCDTQGKVIGWQASYKIGAFSKWPPMRKIPFTRIGLGFPIVNLLEQVIVCSPPGVRFKN